MNGINKTASSIFLAPLMFGIGAVIENTGRPGALAVAHMFYGWAIIWAIGWHGLIVAQIVHAASLDVIKALTPGQD